MTRRIRHCVECPKCRTRYLLGGSPYANGAYLLEVPGTGEPHTLYCPCGKSASVSRWSESKTFIVSTPAYDRGYGTPDEILPLSSKDQQRTPETGRTPYDSTAAGPYGT